MEINISSDDFVGSNTLEGDHASDMKLLNHTNEYAHDLNFKFDKDPENLGPIYEFSKCVSFQKYEKPIDFPKTRDLVEDCKFCYTPTRKWVANFKQFDAYLFIFVLLWLPFVVRFTFQTSYLHYTESQPSLGGKKEGLIMYVSGFLFGLLMSMSEFFNGVKELTDNFMKKDPSESLTRSDEVRFHWGAQVIHSTKSGFPLWKTKNNILANKRPVSFFKWAHKLTLSEFILHTLIASRWMAAIALLAGTFFSLSVTAIVLAKGINDSLHYLFAIHFINGMAFPLFFVYLVKMVYNFVSYQVKSFLVKRHGRTFEEPPRARNGKIVLERPVFAFLSDSCPCTFAVDENSQLPSSYRYSIRYHCFVNGINKYVFAVEVGIFAIYTLIITFYSLFSKIRYRTILS